MDVAVSILSLFAGVGVFLISCTMMSANLQALGGGKLKAFFSKTAKSKLACLGGGAFATAAVQSSSAVTVTVIGFVDAGIVTLAQAAYAIYGANVGTTVTGLFVACGLLGEGFSVAAALSATAGVGAFIAAFSKSDKRKSVGFALAGFGMLFVGLTLMSDAMKTFSSLPLLREFMSAFKSPLLLVFVGAVLTALVQSSSVMTTMTITSVVTGLITLDQGVYLTLGANIGTCVTALLAAATGTRNALRAALVHLVFNVGGVLLFLLGGLILSAAGTGFGEIVGKLLPSAPQMQLAVFHTVFNVVTVVAALPLTPLMIKLVTKLVPDKKSPAARATGK